MKKITFLLLLLFSLISTSSAQSIFEFDFSRMINMNYTELQNRIKPVKNGDFMIVKINNINTFLYKVSIEGKQIELQTPIPTELQRLFRIPDNETREDEKKTLEGLGDTKAALLTMEMINEKKKNILLTNLIKNCAEYVELSEEIAELKFARMELITYAKQNLTFDEMQENIGGLYIPTAHKMRTTYKDFIKYYHIVEVLYEAAQDTVSSADSMKVVKATEHIEDGFDKMNEENILSMIEDILVLQTGLENEKNFNVSSPPIQVEGDLVSYKVSITPTRVNSLSSFKNPLSWTIDAPAYGGWKADFSVGPTLSFGKNSKDEKFFFAPTESDTIATFQMRDNQNSINPSLAAMMHFYKRTGQNKAFGFMFGVGAGFQSVNDPSLSIFLGGSAILGKSRKIMISTGLSYLSIDKLKSPEFVVGQSYNPQKINISEVTEKTFRPSLFVSISYSIANRVDVN